MNDEIEYQEYRETDENPARWNIPTWAWMGGIGVALVAVAAIIIFLVASSGGRSIDSQTVALNAENPSFYHTDGLALELAEGSPEARVTISTIPREMFVGGEAGAMWAAAYGDLPAGLTPLSPIYTIEKSGEGTFSAEMSIPNGAEPLERLDLYRWDDEVEQWVFVPSQVDRSRQIVIFTPPSETTNVMAFQAAASTPAVGVVLSPEGPDLSSTYGLALPEGLSIDETGAVTGTPVTANASTVLPLVKNRSGYFSAYGDQAQREPVINRLVEVASPYNGITLDFNAGEGYADFVAALATQLHTVGRQLDVVLTPADLTAVDAAAIGQHADRVWISPDNNPEAYLENGSVDEMLGELVGQVERRKLGMLVSALHVDVTGAGSTLVSFEQATEPFGGVEAVSGYLGEDGSALAQDTMLPLRLSGTVESMGYDQALKMNYLTYRDEGGTLHHVYFTSAANLQARLRLAREYALSTVAVHGLAHPDAPDRLADGLTAFLSEQPLGEPQPMEIVWQVRDASGAELNKTGGDLSLIQFLWQAQVDPGEYTVEAALSDQNQTSSRGEINVQVVEASAEDTAEPTEEVDSTPGPTPTPRPTTEPGDEEEDTDAATPPPPVASSGAFGAFELGGQVPGVIGHPGQMAAAGMNWVKFQIKWSPGADPAGAAGFISQAHANGFKVLLSIPGPLYPSSIDYNAYVNYLGGVAAYGPDAIEVWNEMNLYTEWPRGQYSPSDYVNKMLAPGFNAIKSASPGTMVIIGALAPTGVDDMDVAMADYRYLQGLAAAGAARYADCVGAHHNAGATAPSATTGHPADGGGGHHSWYFRPTVDVYYSGMGGALPVCLTEFGYVSGEGYGELPSNWSWGSAITVADQAAWLAEGVSISRSLGYVRLAIIWNVDFTYWGSDPQAGYAIVRPDGSCPACSTLGAAMQ